MALNIKINLNNTYPIEALSNDYTLNRFYTKRLNGEDVLMGVNISKRQHSLLSGVYNLAFGPINSQNKIDDKAKIKHQDVSKLFSTIVLTAFNYLNQNKQRYLGIDGSNNARAYLYYRCIQNNFTYLNKFFDLYGVNYYVRILRKEKDADDNYPIDAEDVIGLPQPIILKEVNYDKLYNYFIFKLKDEPENDF